MKVMFYIHSLWVGGAETIVTNYIKELKRQKIDVVLVVNERVDSFLTSEIDNEHIKIISLYSNTGHSLLGKLKRRVNQKILNIGNKWYDIIKTENPDVIHLNTSLELFEKPQFFPASHLIYTFHGEVERCIQIYGSESVQKLHRYSDNGMNFFTLSNRMKNDINNIFKTENIYYVPNGVDFVGLQKNAYSVLKAREIMGVSSNAFIVGQVGRIHPVKNQLRTLYIFKEVLNKRPDSQLVFIGSGGRKYETEVRTRVKELGLLDKVIFMGTRKDATALMAGFDCMILPSLSESFSLVLIEAQAQGIKCISSDAVPEEVVCEPNCIALNLNETDEKWAEYIVNDFTFPHTNNISSFEMQNVVSNMITYYEEIAKK